MPLSNRRAFPLGLAVAAAVLAPIGAVASGDGAGDPVAMPAGLLDAADATPRNRAAEAATGDIDAMRAVVQEIVDCLRANGYRPGDPEVHGASVLIGDWNPGWDSAAGRATRECAFPAS